MTVLRYLHLDVFTDRALEVDSGNVEALIERAVTYGDMGRMTDMLADAREDRFAQTLIAAPISVDVTDFAIDIDIQRVAGVLPRR